MVRSLHTSSVNDLARHEQKRDFNMMGGESVVRKLVIDTICQNIFFSLSADK